MALSRKTREAEFVDRLARQKDAADQDLALAQEVQRLDNLAVRGHVHQMLVGHTRLLLGSHVLNQIRHGVARTRYIR